MKTKATQKRFKAQKSKSCCAMCKPYKRGWSDKKHIGDIRHAQSFDHQVSEL